MNSVEHPAAVLKARVSLEDLYLYNIFNPLSVVQLSSLSTTICLSCIIYHLSLLSCMYVIFCLSSAHHLSTYLLSIYHLSITYCISVYITSIKSIICLSFIISLPFIYQFIICLSFIIYLFICGLSFYRLCLCDIYPSIIYLLNTYVSSTSHYSIILQ